MDDRPVRRAGVRVAACALIGLAGAGLVVAFFLGAPLVSILLAGMLLLCPLLMWAPFGTPGRAERSARD